MNGGRALVTGASAGIGRELARLFAERGHDLVLVARRRDELERLASELGARHGVAADVVACDLAQDGAAARVCEELDRRALDVVYLVNNAGFGLAGRFVETDGAVESSMLHVNVVALTELTKLLLPPMVAARRGGVLNVASTAAFQPGPLMAVYYASKAYVLSFTEALAEELRGTGVAATVLCPGPTRSGFQERAGVGDTMLVRAGLMDARPVAEAGYDALVRGRRVVVPGVKNKVLAQSVRVAPRVVVTRVVKRLQQRAR